MLKEDNLLSLEVLAMAAECLKTIAHPVRLRMIQMLLRRRYTVGELAETCGVASHVASEHLRLMQHCGLMASSKEGRCVYYSVAEPHLEAVMTCIEHRYSEAEAS